MIAKVDIFLIYCYALDTQRKSDAADRYHWSRRISDDVFIFRSLRKLLVL